MVTYLKRNDEKKHTRAREIRVGVTDQLLSKQKTNWIWEEWPIG